MRIRDWSSDVCSSDLLRLARQQRAKTIPLAVQCGGSGDKVVALQRDTCAQHGEIAQLIAQAGRLGLEGRNRDLQQQGGARRIERLLAARQSGLRRLQGEALQRAEGAAELVAASGEVDRLRCLLGAEVLQGDRKSVV